MNHADLWTRAAGRLAVLPLVLGLLACGRQEADTGSAGGAPAASAPPASGAAVTVADAGLQTPESVLYDPDADVYLVTNINGDPLGKDDNGFISRIAPGGEVVQLRWVDGAGEAVTLHAPKGMAIKGDTLFVSDIDTVRAFHRTSGAPLGARGVPGATFLNDLALDADGVLYVSDSGFKAGLETSGTAAVYRLGPGGPVAIASGSELSHPNGLLADSAGITVVPFGGNAIYRIERGGGSPMVLAELPAGQLDGVVRLADGSLLVSSWEAKAVYRVGQSGQVEMVFEQLESPADLGYDTKRGRLLIPLFTQNGVQARAIH